MKITIKFNPWMLLIGAALLTKGTAVIMSTPKGPPTGAIELSTLLDAVVGFWVIVLSFMYRED